LNRLELRTAVWFDFDSTLAHTRHRWHLSPMADPDSTWDAYCAARTGDTPIAGPVAAARVHYLHHQVHVFSGSAESSRQVSLQWLDRHRVPYDSLRQRPPGDRRNNAEIKIGYIRELQALGIDVLFGYEDHPEVAADIEKETGTPVIVVNPRYPEDEEKFRRGRHDGMGGGL
jgi:hypothetical protein